MSINMLDFGGKIVTGRSSEYPHDGVWWKND